MSAVTERPPIYQGRIYEPLHPGRIVVVSGFEFMVPELVLGEREILEDQGAFDKPADASRLAQQLKTVMMGGSNLSDEQTEDLKKRTREAGRESIDALADVVVMALKRNYPDVDRKFVKEHFTQTKLNEAFAAAIGVDPEVGKADAGEVRAAVKAAALNGAMSTAS